MGTLEGDPAELARVAEGGSGYVWLDVRVEETLKGSPETNVPFRFYCTPESNRYGDGGLPDPRWPSSSGSAC